ncbi:MAG: phenylalanine--tRNA ligase subunit beta [Planctomycetaceae bacterium]
MIVSRRWLADYVRLPESTEELTHRLTVSGLNLEEFHEVSGQSEGSDIAIDLEVTSNRPDCLGHLGVAREVSVLFDTPLQIPDAAVAESSQPAKNAVNVSIDCEDLCPEYHARVLRGVRIGPSPAWLKDRLEAIGLTSVNNVVDVTNFVMMECGQPLHAFDLDQLHGAKIVVRRGRRGEKIQAIDQKDYQLTEEMCVIADQDRPVAIAGVMGGFDTEISLQTTNVLIETATFSSMSVRSTARALKLHSPSSYRFERRVDRRNLDWASRRCCELILQVAGGELLADSVVAGTPLTAAPNPVALRFERVGRLLGISVPPQECIAILQKLGLKIIESDEQRVLAEPPSWRPDLTRECDLIEEVARIHGYEHIPTDAPLSVVATARTLRERVQDAARIHLAAAGLSEALTLSFVSEDQRNMLPPEAENTPVTVNHSSRSHENHLRQSLIPSLLQCRRQNERHGSNNAELFEIARVYLSAGQGLPENEAEPLTIGVVAGRSFAELRGLVESLTAAICPGSVLTAAPSDAAEYLSGRGAALQLNGVPLGRMGELSREVLEKSELQDDASFVELRLPVLEQFYLQHRSYTPLPRFPGISRDLNFVLPESVTWATLEQAVRDSAGPLLSGTSFSGQYRGRQLGDNLKSYVITCRFSAADRTLTAEEVDASVCVILDACKSTLDATLRM